MNMWQVLEHMMLNPVPINLTLKLRIKNKVNVFKGKFKIVKEML